LLARYRPVGEEQPLRRMIAGMSLQANTNGRPTTAESTPIVGIRCPHCGRLATAEDRVFLRSPDGPVQRVKIECPAGHSLVPHLGLGDSRWTAA
jgi:hypothetical protein